MISNTNRDLLLEFASNGYEFFPLIKPSGGRKLGTPKGWPSLGTDDLASINTWLETAKYGFGMTFGSKKYFAIDMDGAEGVRNFDQAMKDHEIPSPAVLFKTPSGGMHALYKYPPEISIKNVSGWDIATGGVNSTSKIDVRADGGFIGSFGARDNGYKLIRGGANTELTSLPPEVIINLPTRKEGPSISASAMAMTKELAGLTVDKSQPLYGEIPDVIHKGDRDNTLFNLIASWVRSGLSRKMVLMLADLALDKCEGDKSEINVLDMVDRTMSSPDFIFAKRSLALQTMIDNLVFLTDINRYMILSDKSIMNKQACETRFANVTQEIELASGKTKIVPVFNMWLKDTARLAYRNIGYKPGAGRVYFDSLLGCPVVNTYKQPEIEAEEDEELWALFEEFAATICGGEERGNVLVEFVSYLVQKPGKKIGMAPVIISTKQGVGKNFFLRLVEMIIGESNSIILHSDNITNNFNSATADKQLIIINESVGDDGMSKVTKTKNAQAMSRIKNMITETNQSIERKGQDIVNMKTYANFIFLSNNISAVQMTELDRRFKCIINENPPSDKNYFDKMDILKSKKGLAAIKHGLLNRELTFVTDYMTNYTKTVDDMRVVNSGLTDVEQEILQDIDAGNSIFKSSFMSKEIFMMYIADRYGDEYSMSMCGKLMRVFYDKLRAKETSKDCMVMVVPMPVFFIRDVQRGGQTRQHFIYQRMTPTDKAPLLGNQMNKEFIRRGLELCIKGFTDEKAGNTVIKPQESIIDKSLVE